MHKNLRTLTVSIALLFLGSACTWFATQATPTPDGNRSLVDLANTPRLELIVKAEPQAPLNAPGQIIQFKYNLKNSGGAAIPGQISFTGATVTCPNINTVGNLDANLDPGEAIDCTSSYAITQGDL